MYASCILGMYQTYCSETDDYRCSLFVSREDLQLSFCFTCYTAIFGFSLDQLKPFGTGDQLHYVMTPLTKSVFSDMCCT